jgi:hypothetical protein
MALQAAGESVTADPLTAWPRRDGWFVDRSSGAINVAFNALTTIALVALDPDGPMTQASCDALVAARGERLAPSQVNRQDNALQGWAWTHGTFSWVEPTAWALVAIKRFRRRDRVTLARIAEGESMLLDRVCKDGGWNHGNSNMLGADLEPYVPTTAMGLMALADRRSEPAVIRTHRYLAQARLREPATMALSLAAVALGVFGDPVDDVRTALDAALGRSATLDNLHSAALALYALAGSENGYGAFRV